MEKNEEIWKLTQAILDDIQISFKAKGLFLYIVLANEKNGLTLEMIQKKSKDSERSIIMGISELEKHGYVVRKKQKNEEIRWTYHLIRNISNDKVLESREPDANQHPLKKKSQRKKSSRRRNTAKKTSLNYALSKFLKEFF